MKTTGVKWFRLCSKSWAKAEEAGLTVVTAPEAAKEADIIMA